MRFIGSGIPGVWRVEARRVEDARGFFARTFDRAEAEARGLCAEVAYRAVAQNRRAGTIRGMHFQRDPHGEPKWVSCLRGRIFDVAVDLRPGPGQYRWEAFLLAGDGEGEQAGALSTLYLPPGVAHGYQTLTDDALVEYLIGAPYVPEAGAGLRWDDPMLGIGWPLPVTEINGRDRGWPLIGEDRGGSA